MDQKMFVQVEIWGKNYLFAYKTNYSIFLDNKVLLGTTNLNPVFGKRLVIQQHCFLDKCHGVTLQVSVTVDIFLTISICVKLQ